MCYAFNIGMLQIFTENNSGLGGNGWLTQGKLILAQAGFPTFRSTSKPQMFDLKFEYMSYLSTLSK